MIEVSKILRNSPVAKDTYEMILQAPEIAKCACPGQFVNLRLSSGSDPLLRRPISLHDFDVEKGTISMLYLVVGRGTGMMSKMQIGDTIDVLGPLGNGWDLAPSGENSVLVGGGIGLAPMLPLAQALQSQGKTVHVVVGAKTKEALLQMEAYHALGVPPVISTDDGSAGHHGTVVPCVEELIKAGACDYIYACGPTPMLKAIETLAQSKSIPGQVSMESHMGCGLGACLGCPRKTKAGTYKRTCKDGPVFPIGELDYE